jgi:hypothetical protein
MLLGIQFPSLLSNQHLPLRVPACRPVPLTLLPQLAQLATLSAELLEAQGQPALALEALITAAALDRLAAQQQSESRSPSHTNHQLQSVCERLVASCLAASKQRGLTASTPASPEGTESSSQEGQTAPGETGIGHDTASQSTADGAPARTAVGAFLPPAPSGGEAGHISTIHEASGAAADTSLQRVLQLLADLQAAAAAASCGSKQNSAGAIATGSSSFSPLGTQQRTDGSTHQQWQGPKHGSAQGPHLGHTGLQQRQQQKEQLHSAELGLAPRPSRIKVLVEREEACLAPRPLVPLLPSWPLRRRARGYSASGMYITLYW